MAGTGITQKKSLKEIIAEEYKKCATDPIHFMKKYCMIQHPVRGKIPFHLFPFQESTLTQFAGNRFNIVLKSRQTGISTLSAGYALWKMLFNTDFNVLVIATKQDVAKNLVTKVRVMHELLPSWLKGGSLEDNKLSLRLHNGSQIKAIASSPDAGRSEALSLLIFDEAAFIDDIDEIWVAAQSTLSTGGSCIALSTPNGVGNWFHKTWLNAEEGTNPFNTIRLHWTVHPERGQQWRDEQEKLLGAKKAAQECDCDFVSSGDTVIDPELLMFYKESFCQDPMEKTGFDGNLWRWEYPTAGGSYMVIADVARGSKTRPLIVSKLDEYFREKAVVVRSNRLIDELFTFIFMNGRAEAMKGYNDDLTMAFCIGLWVRDTALRLRQEGIDLTKRAIGGISSNMQHAGVYGPADRDDNPWKMRIGDDFEDLSQWL